MTEARKPVTQRRRKPARSLMQRALALLARREHSRAELRSKLLRGALVLHSESELNETPDNETPDKAHDHVQEEVDRVLDQLVAQKLLSDARFVHARVRVRAPRYGVARIQQELKQYGLEVDLVRDSLKSLAATEFERAWALWSRKFGCVPADDQQRGKQLRFLAARGFSAETAIKVLKKAAQASTALD